MSPNSASSAAFRLVIDNVSDQKAPIICYRNTDELESGTYIHNKAKGEGVYCTTVSANAKNL
jgi:hypothetical protein